MKKLWLLVLTFIVYGCAEEELPVVTNELTVEEVKQAVATKRTSFSQGKTDELVLNFDDAKFGEESIFFSLEGADNLYLSTPGIAKKLQATTSGLAYAYKKNEEVEVELLLPYTTTNDAEFTGFYMATDYLTGESKRIYQFHNGEFISSHAIIASETVKSNNGGRTSGIECVERTTFTLTDVSYSLDGQDYSYMSIQVVGSRTDCYYASSGTADYTEPVRVIESGGAGGRIDEPVCDEPYVSDGEGGCIEEERWVEDQTFGKLCDDVTFKLIGSAFAAEVLNLGLTAKNYREMKIINVDISSSCITIPAHYVNNSVEASQIFAFAFNNARTNIYRELTLNQLDENFVAVRKRLIELINFFLKEEVKGSSYIPFQCSGNIPISEANYGCN